uniref:Uncharacterized protein n=1 Tax=Cacopsylla melanoneura TaxID=428564 RepID=A0A8D8SUK1_9HEMI
MPRHLYKIVTLTMTCNTYSLYVITYWVTTSSRTITRTTSQPVCQYLLGYNLFTNFVIVGSFPSCIKQYPELRSNSVLIFKKVLQFLLRYTPDTEKTHTRLVLILL